jgi:excisionase family DNA binding protein
LTCGTCRTIVVKKDKCLVIYRFSRGRLQSVSRGLQRQGWRSPPGRAVVSCGEAECAGQFFRIWPDATISIARITDSDAASGGNGASKHRNFAESYRLVTAGDGRWTWAIHMGISTSSSFGAPRPHNIQREDRYIDPGGEAAPMSARTPEAEPLLTPAEVATMFRVDPKTVTRWAKAGKLTSIRTLGGHRRYRETEVRALLAGIPQQRSE